jgi:hypothetical protein
MLFAAFFLIICIHGGVWVYSVQNCIEKFQAEFPNFAVDYTHFKKTLDRAIHLFRGTSSVLRKPGSAAVRKRIVGTCIFVKNTDLSHK